MKRFEATVVRESDIESARLPAKLLRRLGEPVPDDVAMLAAYVEHADESLELARGFGQPASKRLSGPEFAAEYHAWDALCRREQYYEVCQGDDYSDRERAGKQKLYGRLNTVYRFAVLPHYDEESA